ncbi:MAG TPA: tRNA pseudouridine synthase A, partial [Phycisphaerales bacterium]|nr:tRNA pseudouridine synthase A [Phycisphaerales bacterium]
KLTIAYDGSGFHGWQRQRVPAGSGGAGGAGNESVECGGQRRTVQQVVERAVRLAVREPVMVTGASRTDAGVHARGQVAAFTCSEGGGGRGWRAELGTGPLVRAINSRLPEDVLVVGCSPAREDFEPIGGAVAKGYSYTLWVSERRPLWERARVQQLWRPVDLGRMRAVAAELVGTHDFAGFAAAGHGRSTTVRRVDCCEVLERDLAEDSWGGWRGDLSGPGPGPGRACASPAGGEAWARRVEIRVSGNGFLWNMVRIIAGTLVEAGRGAIDPERVRRALATGDRRLAGPTLPARGLCLEWIRYNDEACASSTSQPG